MRYMYLFLTIYVSFFSISSYASMLTSDVREITDLRFEVLATKNTKRIFDFYTIVLADDASIKIKDIHISPDGSMRREFSGFGKKEFIEHEVDFFKEHSVKDYSIDVERLDNIESSNRAVVEYVLKMNLYRRAGIEEGGYIEERKVKSTCRDIYEVNGLAVALKRRDCTNRNDYSLDGEMAN